MREHSSEFRIQMAEEAEMRQEQIRKTPRRRPRPVDLAPLVLAPAAPAAAASDDLLDLIDHVLESA